MMFLLSLGLYALMLMLSLVLRLAGKLRLTWPVLYVLAASVSTLFTDWVTEHETLVLLGLGILVLMALISWLVSLARLIREKRNERFMEDDMLWQIRRASELAVPLDGLAFDNDHNLIDPRTGVPVIYGAG